MGDQTESISDKNRSINGRPGRKIYIVGSQIFQNSLMAEILSRKLGIPCVSAKEPDPCILQKESRNLVLFDNHERDALQETISWCRPFFESMEPDCALAIFNVPRELKTIRRALIPGGIKGIFFVNEPLDLFLKGITCILEGTHWYPRELLNRWIREARHPADADLDNFPDLTPREKEILRMVVNGESNDGISRNLYISYHTVKTHLNHIYKKINVSNRLQASLWALKNL